MMMVMLGFKFDPNSGVLGEWRVCDPPLNPTLHPSQHFFTMNVRYATSSVQVIILLFLTDIDRFALFIHH